MTDEYRAASPAHLRQMADTIADAHPEDAARLHRIADAWESSRRLGAIRRALAEAEESAAGWRFAMSQLEGNSADWEGSNPRKGQRAAERVVGILRAALATPADPPTGECRNPHCENGVVAMTDDSGLDMTEFPCPDCSASSKP